MIDRRIDLKQLEEDALMEDLNWSIARFEQVEKLVKNMIAELKRCYEELDVLEELLRTGLMDEEIYNQVKASM